MQAVSDSATRFAGSRQAASGRTGTIGALLDQPAIACAVAVVLLLPSVVWVFRDARVWSWDQAYYASLALQIRYALHAGALAWLSAFLTVPDSRAPLLPWMAQATMPLTRVLGSPEQALLLSVVGASAITLGLEYSTTRRLGGTRAVGLTAMLACAGTSDFIAFNHQFLVEAGQTMAVTGLAWIALRADDASWSRLMAGTLFWVTVALLAKTTSLGYVPPFLLYIGIVCAASHRTRATAGPVDFVLLFGALVLAAIAVAWYAMHWGGIVTHIAEATITSDIVLLYGSDRPLLPKLQFWSGALLQALSPFPWLAGFVLIVAAGVLAGSAARLMRRRFAHLLQQAIETRLLFALCLAGTIVVDLIAYSRMIAEDARYLAPMVSLVVLLFAWSLVTLRSFWLTAGAAVLLVGNWVATHVMAQGLAALPQAALWYLQAPQTNSATTARMARAVRAVCEKARMGRVNVIGADLADFNANSAQFYAEKMRRMAGYRCDYISLGYLESDPKRAIRTLYDTNADFFVTLPLNELPPPGTDRFDRVSRSVAQWIATSPDFERVTPEDDILAVYRRRR
jgi:Dolichyl-phosphate-mannose-protein mannosyltransferase